MKMMLSNIFRKSENIDNKPIAGDLKDTISYYSGYNYGSQNEAQHDQYLNNDVNTNSLSQEEVEVRQVSKNQQVMWGNKEKQYLEKIEDLKIIIEQMKDQVEEREEILEQVLDEREKFRDYTKLVSEVGELNTKRTYEIRESTAKLFKQVKKGMCGLNEDITLNEMADTAIQIYCQMVIKQLQDQ